MTNKVYASIYYQHTSPDINAVSHTNFLLSLNPWQTSLAPTILSKTSQAILLPPSIHSLLPDFLIILEIFLAVKNSIKTTSHNKTLIKKHGCHIFSSLYLWMRVRRVRFGVSVRCGRRSLVIGLVRLPLASHASIATRSYVKPSGVWKESKLSLNSYYN